MLNVNIQGFTSPSVMTSTKKPFFNCPKLDKCISPSIRSGQIIEIVGEAGAGKTQVALSICIGAARDRINNPLISSQDGSALQDVVLFISTEGPFPINRLNEMAMEIAGGKELMDKILVEQISDLIMLVDCLDTKIPQMITNSKISLIVLDSIAGPLRSEFTGDDWKEKITTIHKIGTAITKLARQLDVPIIVVNQVTAYIDQPYESFGRAVVPCFGVALANYIHTRIFVKRTDNVIKRVVESGIDTCQGKKETISANTRIRSLTVDFSPILPSGKAIFFVISKRGINGVEITA